ncbi:hypothetical protein FIBSPDRAFT_329720 [Athelia psychrophila]|uniref:Uncharacterized protein n=1 Tax=Athelia psychrophila TaxID=1759441 RepID=A0A167WJA1_9AGAM|nr:hypothetical protein FIBSPDRAFT_329720 [Fibularhizoctonia sp. CBS 109695]
MRAGSESYSSLSLPTLCFHAPVVSSTVQLCLGSLSVCSGHLSPPLPHLHLHPPTQHTLSASHFHARSHSNFRVHPAPAPIFIQSHRPPPRHSFVVPRTITSLVLPPLHHRTPTRIVPWPYTCALNLAYRTRLVQALDCRRLEVATCRGFSDPF